MVEMFMSATVHQTPEIAYNLVSCGEGKDRGRTKVSRHTYKDRNIETEKMAPPRIDTYTGELVGGKMINLLPPNGQILASYG